MTKMAHALPKHQKMPSHQRITRCFDRLKSEGRKGLIPYITAGDPAPGHTVELLHAMVAAGADLLELGIPFSDPVADGPVIERAHQQAVSQGVTLADVLTMVSEFRNTDNVTPIVLMGYLNPVEIMGYDHFAEQAAAAGVDGVLLVDLPPEDANFIVQPLQRLGIEAISLISPNTSDQRIEDIAATSGGFLYYVSLKGITGAGHLDTDEVSRRVQHIKSFTALPVCVGFGIRDGQSAAQVSMTADAVVVGTVLVELLASHKPFASAQAAVVEALKDMRRAIG